MSDIEKAHKWQPIETAPKDGKTFVDVWGVNPGGRRYPAVRWQDSDHDNLGFTWRRWDGEPIVEMADAVATHWMTMPLPPPPQEGKT